MVGGIVPSPTDATSQETVVSSVQRVVVARARAPSDVDVQQLSRVTRLFAFEGGTRSVVQFEGVLPETAPCVASAPVDLDGQVGFAVKVPPVVHLTGCLYAENGGGFVRKHMTSNLASDWVSQTPNMAVHTITRPSSC